MNLDFAPMEGITGVIYRRLHHEYFPGVDYYYTPFISPTKDHIFTARELREILPENNTDVPVVPQLMSKVSSDFIWAASALNTMGYNEINLNLGCPSGTVTAKGKGCGMLTDLASLDKFLYEIFSHVPFSISIKTRLGMGSPDEFDAILQVFNQYPISKLIIHPRIRADFYRHPIRMDAFDKAIKSSKNPVSYNGSVYSVDTYSRIVNDYPQLSSVMIGQGLTADPFLAGKIKFNTTGDKAILKEFHDRLFSEYSVQFNNRTNAMKRMKEIWVYLICSFEDNDRHRKKLLKAKNPDEYLLAASAVFHDLQLLDKIECNW